MMGPLIDHLYQRSHALAQEELARTVAKLSGVTDGDKQQLEELPAASSTSSCTIPSRCSAIPSRAHAPMTQYLHAVEKLFKLEMTTPRRARVRRESARRGQISRGAIIAGAIVFLGMFLVLAGPSWELAVYRLLQDGGCAALLGSSPPAASAGSHGESSAPDANNSLATVTSIGLGLGIVSLAILSLGLMGWMNQQCAIGILAAGDIVAISVLYVRGKNWDAGKWPARFGRVGLAMGCGRRGGGGRGAGRLLSAGTLVGR